LHLSKSIVSIAESLLKAVSVRDPFLENHSRAVAKIAKIVAAEMGLPVREQDHIYLAGLLHDVGKLGIKDAYLFKQEKLSREDWTEIKKHPVISYELLKEIPGMHYISLMALYHHERYDGNGYPEGLAGEDIPRGARILAVADAFEAMTADRVYRRKMDWRTALAELRRNAGSQFDAAVVSAFCKVLTDRKNECDSHAESADKDFSLIKER